MSKFRGRRLPFVQVAGRWSLARECGVPCTFSFAISILFWIFLTTMDLDISRKVAIQSWILTFFHDVFTTIFKEAGGKGISRKEIHSTTFPVERNWRARWGKVECRNAFDPCTAVAPNKLPHEFPQEQMYEGRFSKRFSNAHARVCAAYYLRGCQRVRIIRTRCHISGWGPCHL